MFYLLSKIFWVLILVFVLGRFKGLTGDSQETRKRTAFALKALNFKQKATCSHTCHFFVSLSTEINCCDPGWQQYKNKCFKYVQTKVNYKNGVQLCSVYNATLASVHSREELLFIEDIARRYSTASGVHWVRSSFLKDTPWDALKIRKL